MTLRGPPGDPPDSAVGDRGGGGGVPVPAPPDPRARALQLQRLPVRRFLDRLHARLVPPPRRARGPAPRSPGEPDRGHDLHRRCGGVRNPGRAPHRPPAVPPPPPSGGGALPPARDARDRRRHLPPLPLPSAPRPARPPHPPP